MLEPIRMCLRCEWLAFLRNLTVLTTKCLLCKRYGAYPCSIAACVPLCEHCAKEESIKLDRKCK